MAIKSEIAWIKRLEDGTKLEVYARRFGREWTFYSRGRRNDIWQEIAEPTREDWDTLLDAVRRRVPRSLFPPDEVTRIQNTIRERFQE
ncbi:MAG: hypothetical protein IT580_12310 [Verrucomicrobiales bacterium]|nr:hypothetical protein [Verrucomicrobiales bacterium]